MVRELWIDPKYIYIWYVNTVLVQRLPIADWEYSFILFGKSTIKYKTCTFNK